MEGATARSSVFRCVATRVAAGLCLTAAAAAPPLAAETRSIWLSPAEIQALPTSGAAWNSLAEVANSDWGSPAIADISSKHDTSTLAGALYAARLGNAAMRAKTVAALEAAIGTELGGDTLGLGRNLLSYVIAADLIDHRSPGFVTWVDQVRHAELDGRTLISTHEQRPNNWGTHAGASRIAASRFVDDSADVVRAAEVFHGWTGNRAVYAGFEFGELDWQANPALPVAINPLGATLLGRNVDGVLPDDQRRCNCAVPACGPFKRENYVWEALQGAVVQAQLLSRLGYPAWQWQDSALLRAVRWLYVQAKYPAEGDDTWVPFLVNATYGSEFRTPLPGGTHPGKNIGYTDWSHPSGLAGLDSDSDGKLDDGDQSGNVGDAPCTNGVGSSCDDNCRFTPNAEQSDQDQDGFGDVCDDCIQLADASQLDADADGFGNACDADFDGSGVAGIGDFQTLLKSLYTSSCTLGFDARADLDGTGSVMISDFARFRMLFQQAPGPSGHSCAGTPPCPL